MGYFDGIVDGSFKSIENGTFIYYPWGILGKGYIIPTLAEKHRIRKSVKRLFKIYFATVELSALLPLLLGVFFIGALSNGSLLYLYVAYFPWIGLLLLWWQIMTKRLLRGFPSTEVKLNVAESYKSSARSHNIITLWVFEVISILFVILFFFLIFKDLFFYFREWQTRAIITLISIFGMVFFGLCGVGIAYMIKIKSSGNQV